MSPQTLRRLDEQVGLLMAGGCGAWIADYHVLQRAELYSELTRQGYEAPPPPPILANSLQKLAPTPADELLAFPGLERLMALINASQQRWFRDLGPRFVEFQQGQRRTRGHVRLTDDDVLVAIRPYLPPGVNRFPEGFWHDPEKWSSPYESQVSCRVVPREEAGKLRGLGARRRSEAESEGAQPAANSAGVW